MPLSPHTVVLLTGSTGNVGLATAHALARAGARLVLLDRASDRLARTFPALAGSPDHLLLSGVNLADESALAAAVGQAMERFGRLDALVNTVGAWRGGTPVHETPVAEWASLHEANVLPLITTARAVVPLFLARGAGRIVNVSARGGLHGEAGSAPYAAAKAAVLRLTESLSAELRDAGINVNAVLPSTIDSAPNRAAMPDADPSRWVTPDALAEVILFLLSDAARAIHGAAIPVYGRC